MRCMSVTDVLGPLSLSIGYSDGFMQPYTNPDHAFSILLNTGSTLDSEKESTVAALS